MAQFVVMGSVWTVDSPKVAGGSVCRRTASSVEIGSNVNKSNRTITEDRAWISDAEPAGVPLGYCRRGIEAAHACWTKRMGAGGDFGIKHNTTNPSVICW